VRNTLFVLSVLTVAAFSALSAQARPDTSSRREWTRTPSGLAYSVIATGSGSVAARGQAVTIHETTTLQNGALLFDSRAKSSPITFVLGKHQVIAGVEEGVTGMRVGERRLLVIPPSLSVRSMYPPNTPKDSTLHIDVELLAIRKL
jgi:FKBP-type peptidyl-prolyl cis-trans isomerase